jgi:hypothetical protein
MVSQVFVCLFRENLHKLTVKETDMKRLFYILFGVVLGAAGAAIFFSRKTKAMQSNINTLQAIKNQWDAANSAMKDMNDKWKAQEQEYIATLSPQEKLNYEMREAIHRSKYPELFNDEEDKDA